MLGCLLPSGTGRDGTGRGSESQYHGACLPLGLAGRCRGTVGPLQVAPRARGYLLSRLYGMA